MYRATYVHVHVHVCPHILICLCYYMHAYYIYPTVIDMHMYMYVREHEQEQEPRPVGPCVFLQAVILDRDPSRVPLGDEDCLLLALGGGEALLDPWPTSNTVGFGISLRGVFGEFGLSLVLVTGVLLAEEGEIISLFPSTIRTPITLVSTFPTSSSFSQPSSEMVLI